MIDVINFFSGTILVEVYARRQYNKTKPNFINLNNYIFYRNGLGEDHKKNYNGIKINILDHLIFSTP